MSPEPRSTPPTSSVVDFHALRPLRGHPIVSGSLALNLDCSGSSTASSKNTSDSSIPPSRAGSSSKTPQGFSPHQIGPGGTWPPSSGVWRNSGMGGPTERWTGDVSERPSDAVESSWLPIVEETPDPLGPFWVTEEQAKKLLVRVASAGSKADPALLQALSDLLGLSSGASPADPGSPALRVVKRRGTRPSSPTSSTASTAAQPSAKRTSSRSTGA